MEVEVEVALAVAAGVIGVAGPARAPVSAFAIAEKTPEPEPGLDFALALEKAPKKMPTMSVVHVNETAEEAAKRDSAVAVNSQTKTRSQGQEQHLRKETAVGECWGSYYVRRKRALDQGRQECEVVVERVVVVEKLWMDLGLLMLKPNLCLLLMRKIRSE